MHRHHRSGHRPIVGVDAAVGPSDQHVRLSASPMETCTLLDPGVELRTRAFSQPRTSGNPHRPDRRPTRSAIDRVVSSGSVMRTSVRTGAVRRPPRATWPRCGLRRSMLSRATGPRCRRSRPGSRPRPGPRPRDRWRYGSIDDAVAQPDPGAGGVFEVQIGVVGPSGRGLGQDLVEDRRVDPELLEPGQRMEGSRRGGGGKLHTGSMAQGNPAGSREGRCAVGCVRVAVCRDRAGRGGRQGLAGVERDRGVRLLRRGGLRRPRPRSALRHRGGPGPLRGRGQAEDPGGSADGRGQPVPCSRCSPTTRPPSAPSGCWC